MMVSALFIPLLLVSVAQLVISQDCSANSQITCLKAFEGSHVLLQAIPGIDAPIPAWNESFPLLNDRCQRFSRFWTCMATVLPYCTQDMSAFFQGWHDAYTDQLCTSDDSLTQFVGYEECFTQPLLTEAVNFCNATYYSKLNTLPAIPSVTTRTSNFCTYTDGYLSCLTSAVTDVCGQDASNWQQNWNYLLRMPQMVYTLGCPNWTDNTSSADSATMWTIMLSIPLGLTIIIIIAGIIIVLVLTHRRKKEQRRAAIPPPPPYTQDPRMMYARGASGGGVDGEGGVVMEAGGPPGDHLFKFPEPPPYADQGSAPAYDNLTITKSPPPADQHTRGVEQNIGGMVNPGFDAPTDSDGYPHIGAVGGAVGGAIGGPAGGAVGGGGSPLSVSATVNASPARTATAAMTESERELNQSWF